jgi:thioredoxin 1
MASTAALGAGLAAAAAGVCYCIAGSAGDERGAVEQPPPAAGASTAAPAGQVLHVIDDAEFKALVSSGKTVIVDFSATWCGPCKAIAPLFAELAGSHPQAVFAKVDVDECEDTAEAQEVTAMPTFQAFSGGKKLESFSGAGKQQLREFVQRHTIGTGATGA